MFISVVSDLDQGTEILLCEAFEKWYKGSKKNWACESVQSINA